MKIRVVFLFLVTVCLMLSMVTTAIGETDIKSVKWSLYDYLIDDYIQKCRSKITLSDSRSKNIRKEAALAALKVEYLDANKDKLIDQMQEAELSMKKYKVHYFLNARFYNHYASQSSLKQKVIEANLSKFRYR